jgi:8-oxo-dGTP pyrophosphatase MutT (NUDIX family)
MDKKHFSIIKCAGGIVINNNRLALVKFKKINGWGFPKGKIEEGENSLEAAKREIFEEIGVKDIKLVKKIGTYQRPTADGQSKLLNIDMFLFETDQEKIYPIEDDVLEAKWYSFNEVQQVLVLDDDKNFFICNQNSLILNNHDKY